MGMGIHKCCTHIMNTSGGDDPGDALTLRQPCIAPDRTKEYPSGAMQLGRDELP